MCRRGGGGSSGFRWLYDKYFGESVRHPHSIFFPCLAPVLVSVLLVGM